MKSTQEDIENGSILKITLGAHQVEGRNGYQGTGVKIEGNGIFKEEGKNFEYMFEKYPFIRSVLEVSISDVK